MKNLQERLKSYKLDINNRLEISEITTGSMTIFTSMVFEDEENNVLVIDRTLLILSKPKFVIYYF